MNARAVASRNVMNECASGSVAEWNGCKMSLIIHFIL
jgi:hypothetical protein